MKSTTLTIVLALFIWQAWGRDVDRLPLREIDRPLILPKGMWEEQLVLTASKHINDSLEDTGTVTITGFLPRLPSWSITDRLSMMAVPFPVVHYLIVGENIDAGREDAVHSLSITLNAGFDAIRYDRRLGLEYSSIWGMNFKKPFTERLWMEGRSHFIVEKPFSSLESYEGSTLGIGIQWSKRIYTITSFSLVQPLKADFGRYHVFDNVLGVNFTSVLSLSWGVNVFSDDYLSENIQLSIRW